MCQPGGAGVAAMSLLVYFCLFSFFVQDLTTQKQTRLLLPIIENPQLKKKIDPFPKCKPLRINHQALDIRCTDRD
jgi:hypothetical protein